jgi:hypothetical protein
MSQLINQSKLFRAEHVESSALIDDAKPAVATRKDAPLALGPSLFLIIILSAILWTGIFFLARFSWHFVMILT